MAVSLSAAQGSSALLLPAWAALSGGGRMCLCTEPPQSCPSSSGWNCLELRFPVPACAGWGGQCMLLPLGDSFGCRTFKLVLCPILCKFPLVVQIIEGRCELLKVACSTREGTNTAGKKAFSGVVAGCHTRVKTGARMSTWMPAWRAAGPEGCGGCSSCCLTKPCRRSSYEASLGFFSIWS